MTEKVTPYQKIPEASKTTGLSQYFLRKGCREGTVPHIKSGVVYMIDIPALLRRLERQSDAGQVSTQAEKGERV